MLSLSQNFLIIHFSILVVLLIGCNQNSVNHIIVSRYGEIETVPDIAYLI